MTTATAQVTFDRFVAGEPARAYFHKLASRPDGQQRSLSMAPEVRDEQLIEQVKALEPGAEVRVTITTDVSNPDLPSWISELAPVAEARAAA
jgi:hypothetical protein